MIKHVTSWSFSIIADGANAHQSICPLKITPRFSKCLLFKYLTLLGGESHDACDIHCHCENDKVFRARNSFLNVISDWHEQTCWCTFAHFLRFVLMTFLAFHAQKLAVGGVKRSDCVPQSVRIRFGSAHIVHALCNAIHTHTVDAVLLARAFRQRVRHTQRENGLN